MSDTGISDGSGRPATAAGAVALDLPGTAEGLDRYRASAWRWCAAGAAAVAAAVLIAVFADRFLRSFVPQLGTIGVLLLLVGAVVPLQARRMRRTLAARPWTAHTSVLLQSGARGAAVVLGGPGPDELLALTPWTTRWRADLLDRPGSVLWWCGDPRTGGVLAPPDGTQLIWARPVRGRRARSIAARPQVKTLLTRPALPQPQSARGQEPVPFDPAPPTETLRRRPWWRGTFRWLLLLGLLLAALATVWIAAAENDPQVDLTVISERADGRCEVRWTDPFDGRTRTGPFHCHGNTGLLKGWDTGFVVSYPPFKGDLYDENLRGTAAVSTTDVVGLSGLALIAVGLVGGAIRIVRGRRLRNRPLPSFTIPRQERAPEPGPSLEAAAPQPPAPLSYAVYAAEAGLQARLRAAPPVKPAVPDRMHPGEPLTWWRVPTLRNATGIAPALWSLSYTGGVVVLALVTGVGTVASGPLVVGAVLGAFGLFRLWRAVTAGIPNARMLAAAATAPAPQVHRYALLYDGREDGPTLVLFPAGESVNAGESVDTGEAGEPDAGARPVGLLPLLPPGPVKDPWAGLPAPTGTVELRGWLDGLPLAVAWIDGCPYWPQNVYEDIAPADAQGLDTRFGLGPVAT